MKNKKLNKLFILALPLALACGVFVPTISVEKVNADSSTPIEISSLSSITDMNGNYKLTSNITLNELFTPIGSVGSPFKGTLDGNGYSIKGLSVNATASPEYQGLFGLTSGAIIKNLRIEGIEYKGVETGISQFYCGAIVAYATNNTTITNCEVDNSSVDAENIFKFKVTYGGLVGCLSNSTIKDSVTYRDQTLTINYDNMNTSSIGGIVGVADSSSCLQNVLNFGDTIVDNEENNVSNNNYVGGIAGLVSDSGTNFKNIVSGGVINVIENPDVADTNYIGGLIGYISNAPSKGNIASGAYIQNYNAFGFDGGYIAKDLANNDYVAKLPTNSVVRNDFYFESNEGFVYSFEENVDKTFKWHPMTNGWSTDLWVMCDVKISESIYENQIRLQQFEYFDINLADTIDYTGLFNKVRDNTDKVGYGEYEELEVAYIVPSNAYYYDIAEIKKDGETCEIEDYSDEIVSEYTQTKDVALFKTTNGYILRIKSTSQTAGKYSFEMNVREFNGYLAAGDGGSVRFSGGTLTARKFNINSLQISAIATPNSTSAFSEWNLYKATTKSAAIEGDKLKTNFYKDTANETYWEKVSTIFSYSEGESGIVAGNKAGAIINIKFGGIIDNCIKVGENANNNYLTDDFLLLASFESDPYKLKVEKTNDNAKDYIRSVVINTTDMSNNTYAAVGKRDVVTIVVKVDALYEINKKTLENSIQNENKRPKITIETTSEKVENEKKVTVYTISFSTEGLSSEKAVDAQKKTFVLSFELSEVVEEENPYKLWIILGSSVGGVLVLGLATWIIVKKILSRKFKNKKTAKIAKTSKKEDKPVSYKDFF